MAKQDKKLKRAKRLQKDKVKKDAALDLPYRGAKFKTEALMPLMGALENSNHDFMLQHGLSSFNLSRVYRSHIKGMRVGKQAGFSEPLLSQFSSQIVTCLEAHGTPLSNQIGVLRTVLGDIEYWTDAEGESGYEKYLEHILGADQHHVHTADCKH